MDAKSGRVCYRERLGAGGSYFSSPVAANGLLILSSFEGVMTVVRAGDRFEVIAQNDFGEPLQATPAISDDTLFVRTASNLYTFRDR